MGRVKTVRNAPRTCDIDIIDFKHMVIKKKLVILPHPRLHLRNFVLYPLKEIEPNWSHPVLNKSIDNLLSELSHFSRMEITRLNKSDINSK
jgi:7,8-dihydro-6-hydroxymethylpterin-pyrophosphokinase